MLSDENEVSVRSLSGHLLKYAVAKSLGLDVLSDGVHYKSKNIDHTSENLLIPDYTDSQFKKLVEDVIFRSNGIHTKKESSNGWVIGEFYSACHDPGNSNLHLYYDKYPIVAGLRCLVSIKIGKSITIPDGIHLC